MPPECALDILKKANLRRKTQSRTLNSKLSPWDLKSTLMHESEILENFMLHVSSLTGILLQTDYGYRDYVQKIEWKLIFWVKKWMNRWSNWRQSIELIFYRISIKIILYKMNGSNHIRMGPNMGPHNYICTFSVHKILYACIYTGIYCKLIEVENLE